MFLSHASELRDFPRRSSYVAAAERAISAAGHVVVEMAGFPAADKAPARVCAERVRGCNVYLGVLGTRYGSPVRDRPEVSYTELEFDTAAEAGLDRLVFLLDTDADDVGIPPSALIDREFGDRQDAFRRRVQDSGLTIQSFANPDALGQLVERSLRELADTRRGTGGAGRREQVQGWPLGKVTDPFALEVHRPIQPDDPEPGLPALPAYVPRGHDAELAGVVRAAAEGRSGIAVLVGGSSTGKTRACWEALWLLRDQKPGWRLWHPIDPSRPEAALRELPGIGLRTVVWLNEAQFYLGTADGGLGERVAAGLRELLRDPARAPVLVLATLWPQFWDGLTARPAGGADPHAQARELLAGHDITVPAALTAPQLQQLGQAGDPRLAQAAAGTQDGQVIQFLAGAPELLARYHNAPPAAAALINAAMDARRLGMGIGLPQAFLEAAAPGYLTDTEWDALGEDWLEQALAYTAKPCKGVSGPLTRIRSRPARSRATGPRTRESGEQPNGGPDVPLYRLADYLEQHGRHQRKSQIPPAGFWVAAAGHALPGDQARLGDAAHARGLYRDAAQLHKNAAARGNLGAALYLANHPHNLRPDVRPVRWAIVHAPLDDPLGVAMLLHSLREAGAAEQAAALLHRDPAVHVSLNDMLGVATLLDELREAGAAEQAAALLHRDPAVHVALDNPLDVTRLLDSLRHAGAQEQVTVLADRAAAHVPLDDPRAVSWLLDSLRHAGAQEQVTVLADRAATRVPLDDPYAVTWLLDSLRWAAGTEQAAALLHRLPLDDPYAVVMRLRELREAGAAEQVTALADHAAAHAALDNPGGVATLLDELREAAGAEQVAALLRRDPAAHASLKDPVGVADLVNNLQEAGAAEQVTALADRAAAHVPLNDTFSVIHLVNHLRDAGAAKQAAALLHRLPLDPVAVVMRLEELREAGAAEQVTALADHAATRVSLNDTFGMASLLDKIRGMGAEEQPSPLAEGVDPRNPALQAYMLLDMLREVGAEEQAAALAGRLPGAGMFELFREQEDRQDRFRFGREVDGSPAGPWGWEDLD